MAFGATEYCVFWLLQTVQAVCWTVHPHRPNCATDVETLHLVNWPRCLDVLALAKGIRKSLA
jgi:hypothetical protein